MMDQFRPLLLLSLTWWIELSNSLCSLRITPIMQRVTIDIDCGGQCRSSSSYLYGQCEDFFSALGIQDCYQGQCTSEIYNLSACITTENEINTTYSANLNAICQCSRCRDDTTNTVATADQQQACTPTIIYKTETANEPVVVNSRNQQSVIVALATIVVILIILLVTVSVWTCWTYKINGATKSQYQQHRIPDTLNATNTSQSSRHVHNPVYGYDDEQPTRPSRPPAWCGKKTEHAYEVIPSTSDKYNSKQRESTAGQAKIHNTAGGATRGTPQVSTGGYNEGQQVGAAGKKDANERHPLDKGREGEGYNKEYDYSHIRHFPNTNVTMKPENQYSKTAHLQNSNATKKPENHYSQTRQAPKPSSAENKPESPQYSTVGKSNVTKKPDGGVNDCVYHTLDMSGENSDEHKDQQDGENEYSAPDGQGGSDGHISKGAQEGGHEYHILEGPEHEYHVLKGPGEENSDTCTGIQSHEYHVLEGPGDSYSSDTNAGIQERDHECHVLEGMTPEL